MARCAVLRSPESTWPHTEAIKTGPSLTRGTLRTRRTLSTTCSEGNTYAVVLKAAASDLWDGVVATRCAPLACYSYATPSWCLQVYTWKESKVTMLDNSTSQLPTPVSRNPTMADVYTQRNGGRQSQHSLWAVCPRT